MADDSRPVFFFDIDNCLYSRTKNVHPHMSALIDQYFVKHLELDQESATKLHEQYYQTYGLAVEGLVRHHKINALDFNAQVDDALPLERILSPEPELRRLLESIDRTKVKLWLFTNAYVNHGRRVVKILGVEDLFEGLTYCDYGAHPFICKPMPAMFEKAFEEAGATKVQDCFFVDDSALNCRAAEQLGWNCVHLLEEGAPAPEQPACKHTIKNLQELKRVLPQFFKAERRLSITAP